LLAPLALLDAWRRRRPAWRAVRDRALFREPAFPAVLLTACALGFVAWAGSFFPAGRGGPCELSGPIGTSICRKEYRLLPPSEHYVMLTRDGEVLASGTVPEPEDYPVAAAWFVLPFVIWGYSRRLRRGRARVRGSRSRSPA
jgi:hypothetical protein